jgi:hypothetical protein
MLQCSIEYFLSNDGVAGSGQFVTRTTLASQKGTYMLLFASLVADLKVRLERRRTYRRKVAEIRDLSTRDLADLRADRSEMLHHLWLETYGPRPN